MAAYGSRRRTIVGLVALLVLAGGIAAAVRTMNRASEVPWITDKSGNQLELYGFSTAGSAKLSPNGLPDITQEDIAAEHADYGTNFVRFLISWRAVEPEPGVYDTAYLDRVEEMVGWYAALGYHVMLDMHQDLYGSGVTADGTTGNGAPVWATRTDGLPVELHNMWELYYLEPGINRAYDHFWGTVGADDLTAHYVGAWRAVAQHFAGNPTVIAYDLMNEPYGGTLQGPAFEAGPLTTLYQETTNAIREVDNDSWVCLEPQAVGVNWGTPSGLGYVNDPRDGDPRIAYCPHLYPLMLDLGGGYTGTNATLVSGTVSTWFQNVLVKASALGDAEPVPVILGEFGLDTTLPGALDYIEVVLEGTQRHHFGVAYWSRDPGSWGPYEDDGSVRNLAEVFPPG